MFNSSCMILHDSDDFQYALSKMVDNLVNVRQNTCPENGKIWSGKVQPSIQSCGPKTINPKILCQYFDRFRNFKQRNRIWDGFVVVYIRLEMHNVGNTSKLSFIWKAKRFYFEYICPEVNLLTFLLTGRNEFKM